MAALTKMPGGSLTLSRAACTRRGVCRSLDNIRRALAKDLDRARATRVTDINTRFGGGFPLPMAAGGDYPFLILAMAAGEDVAPALGTHRAGVVMTRFLSEHILVRDGDRLRAMEGHEEAVSGGI